MEKTDNELMTIENLIMDIEYKNVEQNVLKGIEVGNEALKKLNAVFSIEKIEALLEETEEGIQKQQVNSFSMIIIHDQIPLTNIFFQEINELITGIRVGNELSDENDDELNEELNNILGEQEIQRELPEVPTEELPEIGKHPALIGKTFKNFYVFFVVIEKPEKIKATKEKRERLLVEAQ